MIRKTVAIYIQVLTIFIFLLIPSEISALDIKVDCGLRYQRMDGIGTALYNWTSDIWDYYPTQKFVDDYVGDLGNSMVRFGLGDGFCKDSLPIDKMDNYANYTIDTVSGNDQQIYKALKALQARDPGIKIIGTVWSPPAWMKSNNSVTYGGNLLPQYYEHFARYLYQYYCFLKNVYGITLYGIGPQNELAFVEWYQSCVYSPETYHDMMKVVKAYFKSKGCPVKFYGPEEMTWNTASVVNFVSKLENDSATKGALDFIATHGYSSDGVSSDGGTLLQNRNLYLWAKQYNLPLWMTETSGEFYSWETYPGLSVGAFDGLAQKMHVAFTYGFVQGWTYWAYGGSKDLGNTEFITNSMYDKKYRVQKHYSKFIRPGAYRISAYPDNVDSMLVSAYYDSANTRLTAVLLNTGYTAQPVHFEVAYGKVIDRFQAWRTSEKENFVQLADIAVDSATRTAGFTMPARSMMTIVGTISSGRKGLAPVPPVITCATPFDTSYNIAIPCTLTIDKGVGHYSFDGGNTWINFGMLYEEGKIILQIESSCEFKYYASDGDTTTPVYTRYLYIRPLVDAYQQNANGYVGIEAEGYHDTLTGSGSYSRYHWALTEGPLSTKVMQVQPDDQHALDSGSSGPPLLNSPRMDYRIHFVKSGKHYLWVRATFPQWFKYGDGWQSVRYGLDSAMAGRASANPPMNYNPLAATITPENAPIALQLPNNYMGWTRVAFTVPDTGLHVMNFWMFTDAFMFDRFEICTDSTYTPSSYFTRPKVPANLRVLSSAVDNFSVTWDTVPYAIGYRLYIRKHGESWPNTYFTTNVSTYSYRVTSCKNNGLHAGTTYDFYVVALGKAGNSYETFWGGFGSPFASCTTKTGTGGGHLGFEGLPLGTYPFWNSSDSIGRNYKGYTWWWTSCAYDATILGRMDSISEHACWITGQNSWVQSEPLPGGIGSLSFEVSGGPDGQGIGGGILAISVNGNEVARTHAPLIWHCDRQVYYFPGINIQGNVKLKIYGTWGTSGANNERAIIGNVTWTGYSGGAPNAPANLTGNFESDGIHLYWNGVSGATGYRIYTGGKYPEQRVLIDSVSSGSITTYYDANLKAMQPRKYWITAINANAESVLSDSVKILPYHCMATQNGLWGTYYSGNDAGAGYFFGGTQYGRIDSTIDFPYYINGAGINNAGPFGLITYSAVWVGDVQSLDSGLYKFYIHSPDSFGVYRLARVWVNGELLIDDWTGTTPSDDSGSISLKGNTNYNIIIHFWESDHWCGAPNVRCGTPPVLKLFWSGPSIAKQIIPYSQLSTGPSCTPPPPEIVSVEYRDVSTCNSASGQTILNMSYRTQPGNYDIDLNNDGTFEFTAIPFDTFTRQITIPFSEGQTVTNAQVRDTLGQLSNRFTTSRTFSIPAAKLPTIRAVSYTDPATCISNDGKMILTLVNNFSGAQFAVAFTSGDTFTTNNVILSSDSVLIAGGFKNNNVVDNPRVKNLVTGCISSPYSSSHVFTSRENTAHIDTVYFEEPKSLNGTDGKVIIRLSSNSPSGPYTADLNNDGDNEKPNLIRSSDSLIVSGYKAGDTVVNVAVLPTGASCGSNRIQVVHVFKANITKVALDLPSPVPNGGAFANDTIVPATFTPSPQDGIRTIWYTVCDDTEGCTLSSANRQLYTPGDTIKLNISNGRKVLLFRAEPKANALLEWNNSADGRALYVYKPDFSIVNAWYYDKNADGHLDLCRIEFNKPIPHAPPLVTLTPPQNGNSIDVEPRLISPTMCEADFSGRQFTEMSTGFTTGPFGLLRDTAGVFRIGTFFIGDSAAPVITGARYAMSETCVEENYYDTLVVEFSENIRVAGNTLFGLTGKLQTLTLSSYDVFANTLHGIVIVKKSDIRQVPESGDSMYIRVSLMDEVIADINGTKQNNPSNRKIALNIQAPKDLFRISAGPNPVKIPGQVIMIILRANDRLPSFDQSSRATIKLYDKIGNLLHKGAFSYNNGELRFEWRGLNSYCRYVSEGTYLGILDIDANGMKETKKLKIGVKR